MKRVKNKLRDRSGATILFAILVFMLCILAGTGALTAAAANSGRYTHLKADQQQYLTISSAAKLLKGELTGKTFTAKAKVTDVKTVDGSGPKIERTVTWDGIGEDDALIFASELRPLLIDLFKNYFLYAMATPVSKVPTDTTLTMGTGSILDTTSVSKPAIWDKRNFTINAGTDLGKFKATISIGTDATDLSAQDFTITIELNSGGKYATKLTFLATIAEGAGENGLVSNQISETTGTDSSGNETTTTVTEYTLEVKWLEENTHVTAMPEPTSTGG